MSIFSSWHWPFLNDPSVPFQKNEQLETCNNLDWKGTWTYPQPFKLFNIFPKNFAFTYIYLYLYLNFLRNELWFERCIQKCFLSHVL